MRIAILMKEYHIYQAEIPDDFDFDSEYAFDTLRKLASMSNIDEVVSDGEIVDVIDYDTGDILYE